MKSAASALKRAASGQTERLSACSTLVGPTQRRCVHAAAASQPIACPSATRIPLLTCTPYFRLYSSSAWLLHAHNPSQQAGACASIAEGKSGAAAGSADESGEHQCWACGACVNTFNLFCGKCEYIQPLQKDEVNFFQLLKVPQSFDLDVSLLEANFKQTQRSVHPDLFGTKTKREQEMSADASSAVNAAYKVLRSPSTRAQYLLQLHGIDAIGEASGTSFSDPELLAEVMEAREVLEEAEAESESDSSKGREMVASLERATVKKIKASIEALSSAFKRGALDDAARLTVALQYHTKVKNEVDEFWEKDAMKAATARAAAREREGSKGTAATTAKPHVHGPGCGHDHHHH